MRRTLLREPFNFRPMLHHTRLQRSWHRRLRSHGRRQPLDDNLDLCQIFWHVMMCRDRIYEQLMLMCAAWLEKPREFVETNRQIMTHH